jgi:hypothetical protein
MSPFPGFDEWIGEINDYNDRESVPQHCREPLMRIAQV